MSPLLHQDRAEFICALVWKTTLQTPLGIRFNSYSDGSFRISGVEEGSLFSTAPVVVGDHIISINGIRCSGNGYQEALRRLRQQAGAVTLLVQNIGGNPMCVTTFITKPTPSAKLGIKLRHVEGRLYISALTPKRIASQTCLLKPCDRVLVINGCNCSHKTALEALDMLRKSKREITLHTSSMRRRAADHAVRVANYWLQQQDGGVTVANPSSTLTFATTNTTTTTTTSSLARPRRSSSTTSYGFHGRSEFISAMAYKSTPDMRLGIRFRSFGEDGLFVISHIDRDGLFGSSALCIGDHVMTINDMSCVGTGYRNALHQTRTSTGPITIVARNVDGTSGMVTATISKASPSARVGLAFKNVDGKLCVGFCETSLLSLDDNVITINGVNVSLMRQGDAAELIRRAHSFVTIVATRTVVGPSNNDNTSCDGIVVEVPARVIHHDDESRDEYINDNVRYNGLPRARSVRAISDGSEASFSSAASREPTFNEAEIAHHESGRARFTSVTVWKPTPQTALGLKFMSFDDGSVRISGINPRGLFADSPVRIGDVVVSINDVRCFGDEYQRALHLARKETGTVRLVVRFNAGNPQFTTAAILKPSPATQIGLGFNNNENGRLCVAHSAVSLINAGDLVLSINGIDCRSMRAMDVAEMVHRAIKLVTIKMESRKPTAQLKPVKKNAATEVVIAEIETNSVTGWDKVPCAQAVMAMDENSLPEATLSHFANHHVGVPLLARGRGEFVSAMVWKTTPQTHLGIRFQAHEDGSHRISLIEPGGLFAESPLCVGDIVVSINKVICRGKRNDVALRRLRDTSGVVTIVVRNKGGNSAVVTSSITKPSPSTLLGIGFCNVGSNNNNNSNRLCVSSLQPQGICVDSLLSPGQKILSINGMDCRFLSSKVAADIVRLVPDVITIVAEIPVDSGVVVAAS